MSSRKRVYSEVFLELGFTCIVDKGIQKPQCVVCNAILCKESMKGSKLKDHLIRKHKTLHSKPVDYFRRLEGGLKRQRLDSVNLENVTYDQRDATKSSLQVAWMTARARKPHNIGEELIKPAAVSMAEIMCGTNQADRLKLVPLSNNTIKRRIHELSNDIKDQLISQVKNSGIFAIQVGETTDVASDAQLMVYIRYKGEKEIEEDLLMCSPLETTTKGVDVFRKVDAFFNEPDVQLDWKSCIGVTTDGAPSMLGVNSGFLAYVKKENPSVLATHCIIHRQALAVKSLQPDLEEVMCDVLKMVNYIKSGALNSRLFSSLCGEIDSGHHCLLYYAPTRWLSRGNVLNKYFSSKLRLKCFWTIRGTI
ncbi:SCAN domain-containing protein 3-like [Macrobrachium rosenbergii]|uniref:SCAN domain-containing protein 3-like n=1 Tax=Macrobrachium rosenbergii TaxID=79674 RepID=UPI0034D4E57E